jgi:alkylation response protein AidB-like acyl-CoA dehydrogenase
VTTASTATLVPTLGTAGAAIGAARSYADSIAPGTIERDRAGRVPRAELAAFDRSGLLAVTVPATAGGPDLPISVLADPRDADAAARGRSRWPGAKAFGSEVAGEVGNELFALSGASAADEKYDLSRHWRNARTHASHDPVDWKYHHVGNYLLNNVAPPNHGQI